MSRLLSLLLILSLLCTTIPALGESTVAADEEMLTAEDTEAEDDVYAGITDTGYTVLKRGDRDTDESTDVLLLQRSLGEYGYLRDQADGVYGANTESAVAVFQRNNGLEETGTADAATQTKLFSGTDIVHYEFATDGESVTYRTQEKLALWGFFTGTADGVAGDETNKAIIRFKEYLPKYYINHPLPTPVPVEETPVPAVVLSGYGDAEVAMDELLEPEPTEDPGLTANIDAEVLSFVDGEYDFEVFTQAASGGQDGPEVERVQRRLNVLNYLAKVDGVMGSATERALLYFQKKNNLTLSGIADEATQRCLFSTDAIASEEFVNAYKIVVDKSAQRVNVYQWNGTDYSLQIKSFICSTGLKGGETETPSGTFSAVGPSGTGEWYYFKKYECYAKWGYFIVGGIMFHSVIYSEHKSLNRTSVKKLGRRASHGCIRMEVESAKWIYDNCPAGTTVVIKD